MAHELTVQSGNIAKNFSFAEMTNYFYYIQIEVRENWLDKKIYRGVRIEEEKDVEKVHWRFYIRAYQRFGKRMVHFDVYGLSRRSPLVKAYLAQKGDVIGPNHRNFFDDPTDQRA
jgi:hypothetical protein